MCGQTPGAARHRPGTAKKPTPGAAQPREGVHWGTEFIVAGAETDWSARLEAGESRCRTRRLSKKIRKSLS